MMPPLMLMVRGLMGSGKSTLAAALADTLQLTVLSTDAIRRRRHAAPADAPAYGAGIYSADERRHVYQLLLCEAGQQLAQGASVVIDGTFLSNELRHSAVELSQSAGARLLIVTCYCPEEVARQRIAARNQEGRSVSDARPELLAAQQAEDEPMADDLPHLCLDTTHELSFQVEAVLRCLTVRLSAVGQ
jgi:predicted kinase